MVKHINVSNMKTPRRKIQFGTTKWSNYMSDQTFDAKTPAPGTATDPSTRSDPTWSAVISLSLGVFGLVTAEFLPASLLTPIAQDLGISNGTAGQAVTATAIVGAIVALTIGIVTGRMDRRKVLLTLTFLLVASNLLSAVASNFATLLIARVMLGVSLGGFWSMVAAIAMRLVPMNMVPRALSIVFTGVSLATVCAAPVGAYVGDIWGWRAAF
jgi:predicted MFS family arabinose efflux permease